MFGASIQYVATKTNDDVHLGKVETIRAFECVYEFAQHNVYNYLRVVRWRAIFKNLLIMLFSALFFAVCKSLS